MFDTWYVIERMAADRQADLMRERRAMGERNETQGARAITQRSRTIRLVGVAALALALLWGGLTAHAGGATAGGVGGGSPIGYEP